MDPDEEELDAAPAMQVNAPPAAGPSISTHLNGDPINYEFHQLDSLIFSSEPLQPLPEAKAEPVIAPAKSSTMQKGGGSAALTGNVRQIVVAPAPAAATKVEGPRWNSAHSALAQDLSASAPMSQSVSMRRASVLQREPIHGRSQSIDAEVAGEELLASRYVPCAL